jgi:hypothetical protein
VNACDLLIINHRCINQRTRYVQRDLYERYLFFSLPLVTHGIQRMNKRNATFTRSVKNRRTISRTNGALFSSNNAVTAIRTPQAYFVVTLCKFGRTNDRLCSEKMFIISKRSSLLAIPLSLLILHFARSIDVDFDISRYIAAFGRVHFVRVAYRIMPINGI